MSKSDRDLDPRTPSTSTGSSRSPRPLPPAARRDRGRRRAARHPDRRPRRGRVLRVLAAGRRRIVEVGTAYGYSTLWLALGQPADGTIVTIDPDRERTDLARGWWREAGHRRRADHGRQRAGARGVRGRRAGARRAVRPRLHRRAQARVRAPTSRRSSAALAPGALVVADNVLWSGRVVGRPAGRGRRREHRRAARVRCGGPRRPALHRDDPAGRRRAAHRDLARLTGRGDGGVARPGPAVRGPARAGRDARGRARPPDGADVEAAWAALVAPHPGPRARPAVDAVRPQRRLRRPGDGAGRRRRGGDDPAGLRRVGPVAGGGRRILELRETPFDDRDPGRAGRRAWRSPRTAPSSGSSAGPGRRPARRRPARRPRPPATPAGPSNALEYEAHEPMALAILGDDRRRDRGALRGRPAGDRPSDRRGPARRGVDRGRRRRAAPGRGVRGRPLRDRRDEGPGADLEGRAVRRRPRLDRPPGADRPARRTR